MPRLSDLSDLDYSRAIADAAVRYHLRLSIPRERVGAVRLAERLVAGEPVEPPVLDAERLRATQFQPAVADAVGPDAHRWLAFLESVILLLNLRRDVEADRRRADGVGAGMRPDLLPASPRDRELAIVAFVPSGAPGHPGGRVPSDGERGRKVTASAGDYEAALARVAQREGLHLARPADRARAAALLVAEAPEHAMAPATRAHAARRAARGEERVFTSTEGAGMTPEQAQRRWTELLDAELKSRNLIRPSPTTSPANDAGYAQVVEWLRSQHAVLMQVQMGRTA